MKMVVFMMVAVSLCARGVAHAEEWPSLEDYVARCALIIKAKAIVAPNKSVSFEMVETWKGTYNPQGLMRSTPEGAYGPFDNSYRVANGQEIVFFFTQYHPRNQSKLDQHSTAFPITNGKLTYASTGWFMAKEYTVPDFRDTIQSQVRQEDDLMRIIGALSFRRLRILKSRVDELLEDRLQQRGGTVDSGGVVPRTQPAKTE